MKIAIMQPYLFPYLGYFQLIAAVDIFVSLDDVNFIKRGWINRNNLFINGKASLFSVPLRNASQNEPINEVEVSPTFKEWRAKFFRTLKQWYGREKFYKEGLDIASEILNYDTAKIGAINLNGLKLISRRLGLNTQFYSSAELNMPMSKGAARLVAIAQSFGADVYVNPPGGKKLYCEDMMTPYGVDLKFLKPNLTPYSMPVWIPALSALDPIMRIGFERIKEKYLPGWGLERGLKSF